MKYGARVIVKHEGIKDERVYEVCNLDTQAESKSALADLTKQYKSYGRITDHMLLKFA